MRSLTLTLVAFCHVLLASFILYSTLASALPAAVPCPVSSTGSKSSCSLATQSKASEKEPMAGKSAPPAPAVESVQPQQQSQASPAKSVESAYVKEASIVERKAPSVVSQPASPAAVATKQRESVPMDPRLAYTISQSGPKQPTGGNDALVARVNKIDVAPKAQEQHSSAPMKVSSEPHVTVAAAVGSPVVPVQQQSVAAPIVVHTKPSQLYNVGQPDSSLEARMAPTKAAESAPAIQPAAAQASPVVVVQPKQPIAAPAAAAAPVAEPQKVVPTPVEPIKAAAAEPVAIVPSTVTKVVEPPVASAQPVAPVVHQSQEPKEAMLVLQQQEQPQQREVAVAPVVVSAPVAAPASAPQPTSSKVTTIQSVKAPVVKGGLGPLYLLAATLCSYQQEKPVADETLNALYARRASVRKSLFDFMSLKFVNMEKLSSKLNGFGGLEMMPRKSAEPSSHGWPVVGKCTAHDLKLMAEAAWCECAEGTNCVSPPKAAAAVAPASADSEAAAAATAAAAAAEEKPAIITSNQHQARARSLEPADVAAGDQTAVISKILHVADVKEAPVVESTLASLNLTNQQLATIQAQATSTRECRRNALQMTKTLFYHLAEDQKSPSDTWTDLYGRMYDDECARKRMVDIVNALSGFRSEASSIRRDNMEYAFAMDDLRSKVLESEVDQPLTFDRQFIEVEQFLQQSVKLMLANIDPGRARLTSMRYRSLMSAPVSADDQCIELHQRLMSKSYPSDCNPTQFGQLPDVLRMAASSLELWSIESELSKLQTVKAPHEYPMSAGGVQSKQEINECIANLVMS